MYMYAVARGEVRTESESDCLEDTDADLSDVKVDEVVLLVIDIAPKVAPHEAVPVSMIPRL